MCGGMRASLVRVLARSVGSGVPVRLLDSLEAVDFPDVRRNGAGYERLPVAIAEHPLSNLRPAEVLPGDHRQGNDIDPALLEEADDEGGVRVHRVELRDQGEDVADPDAVDVGVRDRDDVIVSDSLRVQGALYHLESLRRGERVLPRMAVLGRANPDDHRVVLLKNALRSRQVTVVEGLEPADEEGATSLHP